MERHGTRSFQTEEQVQRIQEPAWIFEGKKVSVVGA